MQIKDFSIEFQQKFDFGGKPYRFDKIDVPLGQEIKSSTLGKYQNYISDQQNNVMIVFSDGIVIKSSSSFTSLFDSGEVVYLSTLLNYLNADNVKFYFAEIAVYLGVSSFGLEGTVQYKYRQLAGTFYIFDFNEIS